MNVIPTKTVVRLRDLLPPLRDALNAARDADGWNAETLRRVISHEFDFLGPFVTAEVEAGPDHGATDEFLVLTFTPPESRNLSSAERAFSKAAQRAERGDVRGSVSELERIAKAFPEVAKYRRALGQAYLILEQWDRCRGELLKSLALDPIDPDALTLLGNFYAKRDEPAMAIPLYRRSLELKTNVYALTNIGAALSTIGEKQEALLLLREAVRLDPKYPNAWFGLGLTLSKLEDLSRLPEAIKALDHALEAAGKRRNAPQIWDSARGLLQGLSDIEASEEAKRADPMIRSVTEEVAANDGLPVEVEEGILPGILAKIELGWVHGRQAHRLIVNRRAGVERVHQVRHELEHVRLANAARASRVNRWFASSAETREVALRAIGNDVKRLARLGFPEKDLTSVVMSWIDGLLLQVYNFPVDLLIETRLLEEHPEYQELWYYSLRLQLETSAKIAEDPRLAEMTARIILRANTAMNGAFALWFEERFPRRTDLLGACPSNRTGL